jgi:hypothetical protein
MRVIVLYHPKSEQEGPVLEFVENYKRLKGKELELVSLETVEGAETAKLYDITSYPAVLAIASDGQLLRVWQGEQLPPLSELDYYTTQ